MRKLFGFAFVRITNKDQIVVKDDVHDLCVYKVRTVLNGSSGVGWGGVGVGLGAGGWGVGLELSNFGSRGFVHTCY